MRRALRQTFQIKLAGLVVIALMAVVVGVVTGDVATVAVGVVCGVVGGLAYMYGLRHMEGEREP